MEIIKMPQMELCSLNFMIPIGHAHDPKDGMAHLIEHLLFHCHPLYSQEEFYRKLEDFGGIFNAQVGVDATVVYGRIQKKYINSAIKLFQEVLENLTYKQVFLFQEKEIIRMEMKLIEQRFNMNTLTSSVYHYQFPNHPYGNRTFNEKSFNSICEEEINERMKHYHFSNWKIVVIGNINRRDFIDFRSFYNAGFRLDEKPIKIKKEIQTIREIGSGTGVLLSIPLKKEFSRLDASVFFNTCVKGLSTFVYEKAIKEKGLTYGIHTHYTQFKLYKGLEIGWLTTPAKIQESKEFLELFAENHLSSFSIDGFNKAIEKTITEEYLLKENFGLYANEIMHSFIMSAQRPSFEHDILQLQRLKIEDYAAKVKQAFSHYTLLINEEN